MKKRDFCPFFFILPPTEGAAERAYDERRYRERKKKTKTELAP